ncbi:MAG TPA: phosphate signaling complex protein PhoU [Candidatus Fraserbacteria bacterium]|mgnify:CR=1 FL=1|nr:phosphate signaling complex protein PhoU [Candidatus Fraserbacteria bacterium]
MVRESYQRQLQELVETTWQMGQEVLAGLEMALRALRDHDRALAQGMDHWDDQVDDLNLELEKRCIDLLALQQPVAVDLRLITSVFKIITDLERAADLAVNIGEYSLTANVSVLLSPQELLRLGEFAGGMLGDGLEAFRRTDLAEARAVIERDRQMDQMCWDLRQRVLSQLIASARQAHSSEEAKGIADDVILALWTIRDLERISDHAVNIGGRTVYRVTGSKKYL